MADVESARLRGQACPLGAGRRLRGFNLIIMALEPVAQRTEWWADLEVNPDEEFQSHMIVRDLAPRQEFEFGRRRAEECFDGVAGLPRYALPPRFKTPAASAVWPSFAAEDMFQATVDGERRLMTLRGMGPLLAPRTKGPAP